MTGAVVPRAEPRSYYDRPVIKAPVWKPEVPWYFFTGGLAGASSMLAAVARLRGEPGLATAARRAAAAGAVVSPVLLVADLGVPSRFLNMLRVFRPTSPLSMGSWLLAGYVPAALASAILDETGRLPKLQRLAEATAAAGAIGMTTYTAVLVSDTAVPAWHEARRELPFVFAGTAGASAGAAAMVLTGDGTGTARRLTFLALAMEETAARAMKQRLGELGEPYEEGGAGRFMKAARALMLGGAVVTAVAGRRRGGAVVGGVMVLAGAVCERWGVFRAGFQSAERPEDTVGPQRERIAARRDG